MSFVFRSMFWLAVVAAFMPRDFDGRGATVSLADTRAAIAAADTDAFCRAQAEVCDAGEEIVDVTKIAARYAADRALKALNERD